MFVVWPCDSEYGIYFEEVVVDGAVVGAVAGTMRVCMTTCVTDSARFTPRRSGFRP